MKFVAAIVVLAFLIGVYVVAEATYRNLKARKARWEIQEDADGEQVTLYAAKPGCDRLLVGAVPFAAADFEERMIGLREDAADRIGTLNTRVR